MKTITDRPNLRLVERNYKILRWISPAHPRTSVFMSNKKNTNVDQYQWFSKNV